MPNLATMSATKIRALADKRNAAHLVNINRVIAVGGGNLTGSDIRAIAASNATHSDIARDWVATSNALQSVYDEMDARERWHGGMQPIRKRA